jgi:serine/threonine protein kinase
VEVLRPFTPAVLPGRDASFGRADPSTLPQESRRPIGTPAGTRGAEWAALWTSPSSGYVNAKLSSRISEGMKQYFFEGKPVFPAYAHGASKPEKEEGLPRMEVGRGKSHVVTERYNESASVYRKEPHNDYLETDLEKVIAAGKVMDDVARVLLSSDPETQRMSQHFAIELLKEVRDGQPVFLTRAVDGFTLKKYLRTTNNRREFPAEQLNDKAKELFEALDWLRDKGYFQDDLSLENVMYDRTTGKLVLIDFDSLKRHDASTQQAYADGVQTLRDLLGLSPA